MSVVFWMSIVAGTALFIGVMLNGGWTVPKTGGGWVGLLGVVLLQGASIPLCSAAIAPKPGRTVAVLNNLQPVASIAAAAVLFSEVLVEEVIDAAMVLGGHSSHAVAGPHRQTQASTKVGGD